MDSSERKRLLNIEHGGRYYPEAKARAEDTAVTPEQRAFLHDVAPTDTDRVKRYVHDMDK